MDGIFHPDQADAAYCWQLLREYEILQASQIYTLLKRCDVRKNNRQRVVNALTGSGRVVRQTFDGQPHLLIRPGLRPEGRYLHRIKCFWVLLDYLSDAEFHCAGDAFAQIVMTVSGRDYGIVYVEQHCERLCAAEMGRRGKMKYILVVEDTEQIPLLSGERVAIYAIVSSTGQVEYFEGVTT